MAVAASFEKSEAVFRAFGYDFRPILPRFAAREEYSLNAFDIMHFLLHKNGESLVDKEQCRRLAIGISTKICSIT